MNKRMTLAAAACLAGAAMADTNEVTTLDTVVVYASRTGDTTRDMAADVRVYQAGDIADSGARDLPDFLAKKAGVDIRTLNGNPMQSQIAMRGFGENSFGRVKVLLDGEELNNVDMFAPNLMRVPLWSVERVKVIHGPSPVLYGDGAVAGVVNVLTATDDYDRKTRIAARGGSFGTFGANASTKGGFEEEGLQYSGFYDYLRSDGYRARSGYETHTAGGSVRKNFDNGSTFAVRGNYQYASYKLPGSLSYGQWKSHAAQASTHRDWSRVWNYGAGFDSKMRIADDQWLYLDGAFSHQNRHARWGDYGYANDYELYGLSLSPRYVNEKDVFGLGSKFTAGVDVRYDRDNITDRSGFNNRNYHFDRIRFGEFLHEELWITDELSAIAGARLETIRSRWSHYKGLVDPTSTDWMGDYELGLVYRPVEGLKTFLKAARFHRAPFCDEMNYTKNGKPLDPETGFSLDVGTEWRFLDEFTFDADVYGMLMDDEIFYNPYASSGEYGWNGYKCNSPSRTRRAGLDVGLGWKRDKVAEASIRYSGVYADFAKGQYSGEHVPLVPNHRVRIEAGVWIFDDLEVIGGFRYVSPQRLAGDFNNAHDELKESFVFDVGAIYKPSWAEGWTLSATVDNLFDYDYCDFAGWSDWSGAYYYPACGRGFLVTLSYEF